MKSRKRLSLIIVATLLTLGITAFATSGFVKTWFSSSSFVPDHKTLPTAEEVKKDIGYEAVLIETFENGYEFKDGSIADNTFANENGNAVEKFKSLSLRYEKDGDKLYFSQQKFSTPLEKEGEIRDTENGTDIYGYSYTNKLVPLHYKLTDEDKKAEENGELVFSYGASKIETIKIQSVNWEKDGIKYCLMQMDGRLTEPELTEMAKEGINLQKKTKK